MTIPVLLNINPYVGNPGASRINLYREPPEGAKAANFVINWRADYPLISGNTGSIQLDLSRIPEGFSQIAAAYVDNSGSAHDVILYVPDTNMQYVIRAASTAYIPIMTAGKLLYLTSSSTPGILDNCLITVFNTFISGYTAEQAIQISGQPISVTISGQPVSVTISGQPITANPSDQVSFFSAANFSQPGAAAVNVPILAAGTHAWITAVDFEVSALTVTVATAIAFMKINTASGVTLMQQDTFVQIAAAPNPSSDKCILRMSGISVMTTDGLQLSTGMAANGGGVSSGGYSANICYHL